MQRLGSAVMFGTTKQVIKFEIVATGEIFKSQQKFG